MNELGVVEAIGIIRNLRTLEPTSEDDNETLRKFLQYVGHYGISQIQAAEVALAIAESGTRLSFSHLWPLTNVHSTGAPGSLTTLLSPILAAASGFYVPIVSVKGGVAGAIDSLVTIPGYDDGVPPDKIVSILESTRLAHVGHTTADYAYADKILWRLRKDTDTKSVPQLIAASLLGKMLSVGVRHGVVDVRVGPAGNAGADIHIATDTAYAIVGTANALGMRVTCVLSDATALQWKEVGRIEAVRSLWKVLSQPAQYASNPHVQLCILVASCACHAACPMTPLDEWAEKLDEVLQNGTALTIFTISVRAHGGHTNSLDELNSLAASRYTVEVDLRNKPYAPDLKKVSNTIKSLREEIGPKRQDEVGLVVDEALETATVFLPSGCWDLEEKARQTITDALTENVLLQPILTRILFYTGNILAGEDREGSLPHNP